MHVYFTTVNRGAPIEHGGELVRLDWRTKTVESVAPIFPSNPTLVDPNPRGNTRGGRGVARAGDELVVASYHTLSVFGRDLEHRRDITHPLFVGLHETTPTENGTLWVTSTAIDAAMEVDLATGRIQRQFWPREMPAFQRRWGLTPLLIDKDADNRGGYLASEHLKHPSHLHLNAIAVWRGQIHALFNKFGAIVNLDTSEVLIEDRSLRGAHNLRIEEDGTAFVNDTLHRAVRVYDLPSRSFKTTVALTGFQPIQLIERRYRFSDRAAQWLKRLGLRTPFARPIFVRGMDRVGDFLFVGMSPAAIACIDVNNASLVDFFPHSNNVGVCVHGITVVTSTPEPPPAAGH